MVKGNGGRNSIQFPGVDNGRIPLVGEDPAARAQRCSAELNKLVKSFNCVMIPVTVIAAGQLTQRIDIVPQEKLPQA